MKETKNTEKRNGLCPVYDIECPSGAKAAASCEMRFTSDYNPLTTYRDADIEHCALFRMEQETGIAPPKPDKQKSAEDGE
ncbi:MAG: hypothetical protein HQ508_08000 [Candidatus Marinimicrobia bacterium]|nr:hypothetical protein [Candidatus Neomarinimicrobiota bacterium]